MATAASSFLVLSLWLALAFGAQLRAWSWGPAGVALAIALVLAAASALRGRRDVVGPGTLALALATAGWFAWRAWTSPVAEFARADLFLLGAAVGCFLVARLIAHDARAEAVFLWGVAVALVASVAMVALQVGDAGASHFRARPTHLPTGFFGHYNAGANFLFGSAFLLAGTALFGRHARGVKWLWLLIALAAIAAVYFTRSRGAVLGVVVGFLALSALIVVIGSKRNARWYPPALVAFPLVLLGLGFLLFLGWDRVQETRTGGPSDVTRMMDNQSRLRNYSLAFETTMLHPLTGGGSRSYSYELNHVWDPIEHGLASHLPEQVHNEILQAATDYGLLGAGALLLLFGWIVLRGFWHGKFDEEKPGREANPVSRDALRLGGLAALAAIFAQSNFSFVFHFLPGVMLLGLALGRLATPARQSPGLARTGAYAAAALAIALAAVLVWPAVTQTRVLAAMAPVYFKIGPAPNADARIDHYTRAIAISPKADFHQQRAIIHHRHALDGDSIADRERLDVAVDNYLAAMRLHPKFPGHPVNAANLLSLAGDAAQAEALYEEAIRLQGNMEPAFQAHFHKAKHFQRIGSRKYAEGDFRGSLRAMQNAADQMLLVQEKSAWISRDARELADMIHLGLAMAQEAAGDPAAAIATIDAAVQMHRNLRLRYYAGVIQYRHANAVWMKRRPADAFPLFRDARSRLQATRNQLPPGVTTDMLREQVDSIDETLALLRAAGFGDD